MFNDINKEIVKIFLKNLRFGINIKRRQYYEHSQDKNCLKLFNKYLYYIKIKRASPKMLQVYYKEACSVLISLLNIIITMFSKVFL